MSLGKNGVASAFAGSPDKLFFGDFMTVAYIRDSKSRGYTVIGITEDGERKPYTVSNNFLSELSLSLGEDIDSHTLLLIKGEDEIYRAKVRALKILSYGDNSRRALYNKLLRAGFSREVTIRTVDEMCSLGYIRERDRLLRLITEEVNIRLVGKYKLIPKLISKGYSRSDIESAISELTADGSIDFKKASEELIRKKLGDEPSDEEIKKLLYKNGYCV